MNLPSSLFPSIDLTNIEDGYSTIPTKAIWDVWGSFRGERSIANGVYKFNEKKVLASLYSSLIALIVLFWCRGLMLIKIIDIMTN